MDTKDPDGVLSWLINQLQDAENTGNKVHILGHIPTGQGDCLKWWSWNFYKIVERYENTIRGQFFGHTHRNEFTIFYENADYHARPIGVQISAPGITPMNYHNPAYMIHTIDGSHSNTTWVKKFFKTC